MANFNYGIPEGNEFNPVIYLKPYKNVFLEQSVATNPKAKERKFINPQTKQEGSKWEINHDRGLIGLLGKITRRENKYNNKAQNINIYIKTPDCDFCINTDELSSVYKSLALRLSNIDFGKPIYVSLFETDKTDKEGNKKTYNGRQLKNQNFVIRQNKTNADLHPSKWATVPVNEKAKEKLSDWEAIKDKAGNFISYDTSDQRNELWLLTESFWNEKHDFSTLSSFFDASVKTNISSSIPIVEVEPLDSDIDFSQDTQESHVQPVTDSTNTEDDLPF